MGANIMNLGTFSISLTVKDIKASQEFYEKLGFKKILGDESQNWLILESGEAKIGLFQGMFEQNLMTFNPRDARAIQRNLKAQGIVPTEADESGTGPAHFTLADPDGNTLLFDQHEPELMPKPNGKVSWVDLTIPDAEAVRDFYQAVVGWQPEGLSMGDYEDYMMKRDNGDAAAGICWKRDENANVPSGWMIYITVSDMDAAIEQVKAKGGKVREIRKDDKDKPYMVYIEDPAGAVCALFSG
jgi:predicted enzyme related to lactoylglutathione lyase